MMDSMLRGASWLADSTFLSLSQPVERRKTTFWTEKGTNVVLLLELLGKVLYEGVFNVTAIEMTVVCGLLTTSWPFEKASTATKREEWPTSIKTT
jgi:hypothetical protein